MYAVIQTGGKQYRVAQNDVITVEKIDADVGAAVSLDKVLMIGEGPSIAMGAAVAGKIVTAEVVEQTRGPKIIIFKKRRRQNSRRKNGHRQDLTVLKITALPAA
jgi:large subunit ribosomal protein L21